MKTCKFLIIIGLLLVITACAPLLNAPQPTLTPPDALAIQAYPWADMLPIHTGICFEAALARAGQTIIIRSAAEHTAFYNAIDSSGVCRLPVRRDPFNFQGGSLMLVGTWTYGVGCTAAHDVVAFEQSAATLTITLQFNAVGDCPYELLRPFWIGVSSEQTVQLDVSLP